MTTGAWPSHGVHEGIPAEDYHSVADACSNSRLADLMRSPAYCFWKMNNITEQTTAMKLGTAKHYAVLEPEKVEERYLVSKTCEATKGNGSRCTNAGLKFVEGAWLCGVHGKGQECSVGDRVILTQDEMDLVLGVRDAVHSNRAAAALLGGQTRREVSLFWEDHQTQLDCKGRPDLMAGDLLVDFKNSIDAHPNRIERAIANRGWHRQAAFYLRGLAVLGYQMTGALIIAAEPEPPHEVCVYALDAEAIRVGEEMVRRLMKQFHQCLRTKTWPGYPAGVQSAGVPMWASREAFPEEYV